MSFPLSDTTVALQGAANGSISKQGWVPNAQGRLTWRTRCLLFVACTRARDHLCVSYSGSPSPFLPSG